ncbi:hypothetical protein HDU93_001270 [Gonapodya sp. JEL0774]|nr:hypothetical protein HDU93_001270 [Gonapodya sp. JEL0774]
MDFLSRDVRVISLRDLAQVWSGPTGFPNQPKKSPASLKSHCLEALRHLWTFNEKKRFVKLKRSLHSKLTRLSRELFIEIATYLLFRSPRFGEVVVDSTSDCSRALYSHLIIVIRPRLLEFESLLKEEPQDVVALTTYARLQVLLACAKYMKVASSAVLQGMLFRNAPDEKEIKAAECPDRKSQAPESQVANFVQPEVPRSDVLSPTSESATPEVPPVPKTPLREFIDNHLSIIKRMETRVVRAGATPTTEERGAEFWGMADANLAISFSFMYLLAGRVFTYGDPTMKDFENGEYHYNKALIFVDLACLPASHGHTQETLSTLSVGKLPAAMKYGAATRMAHRVVREIAVLKLLRGDCVASLKWLRRAELFGWLLFQAPMDAMEHKEGFSSEIGESETHSLESRNGESSVQRGLGREQSMDSVWRG